MKSDDFLYTRYQNLEMDANDQSKLSSDYFTQPVVPDDEDNQFTLMSELLHNIQSSKCIKEIIDQYNDCFLFKHQYDILKILPILQIRLQDISKSYDDFEVQISTTKELIEDLMERFNALNLKLNLLFNSIESTSLDSKIFHITDLTLKTFKAFGSTFTPSFLNLINHVLDTCSFSASQYIKVQNIIYETITKEIYDTEWIKQHLKKINEELLNFQHLISSSDLRITINNLLQNYFVVDFMIKKTKHSIVSRGNSNPLVSKEIVVDVEDLEMLNKDFFKHFTVLINSIYVSQNKKFELVNAIESYSLIVNRLFEVEKSGV